VAGSIIQSEVRDVLDKLRIKLPGVQAAILAGRNQIVDCVLLDPSLDLDTIAAEYGTLFRIAHRTSEDAGAGALVEQIVVAAESIIVARCISSDEFLILVCRSQDQIGRARYELRQAAWELQRRGVVKKA
jgi:predicted regulator of Ras-like GTPase activity (Roadblock/LC7/MglB family)